MQRLISTPSIRALALASVFAAIAAPPTSACGEANEAVVEAVLPRSVEWRCPNELVVIELIEYTHF